MKKILFTLLSLSLAFICRPAPATKIVTVPPSCNEAETNELPCDANVLCDCETEANDSNAAECHKIDQWECQGSRVECLVIYFEDRGECLPISCKTGYKLNDNDQCVPLCGEGEICDANGNVTGCQAGYYNSGTSTNIHCEPCGTGVATCTDGDTATSCTSGYYLNGSKCQKCPDNATCPGGTKPFTCRDQYYLDITNQTCSLCANKYPNAYTCTLDKITKCKSNYLLYNNECITCPDNATCDGTDNLTCTLNFYKDGPTTCTRCPQLENVHTADGGTAQTGTIINGATSRSKCMLMPGTYTDEKGTFEVSGTCPITDFE